MGSPRPGWKDSPSSSMLFASGSMFTESARLSSPIPSSRMPLWLDLIPSMVSLIVSYGVCNTEYSSELVELVVAKKV